MWSRNEHRREIKRLWERWGLRTPKPNKCAGDVINFWGKPGEKKEGDPKNGKNKGVNNY